MYARIMSGQIKPGKLDEAVRLYHEFVVPDVDKFKGFKGLLVLTNPETNKMISLAWYETEADMKAQEESGWLREKMAGFGPLMASAPVTEYFEANIQV